MALKTRLRWAGSKPGCLGMPSGRHIASQMADESPQTPPATELRTARRCFVLLGLASPDSPTVLATLTGPANYVNAVAFSPDGNSLAAGSSDESVCGSGTWPIRGARP